MDLIFHSPVNPLSLGNVGFNLLREFYKRGYNVGWFPEGQTDLSAYKVDEKFVAWLQKSANQRYEFLGKGLPSINNWHIAGSEKMYSEKSVLLTYHEVNNCTNVEKAIVSNQYKTLFCGGFSEKVFRAAGLNNVGSFDLGFDEDFHVTDRKYLEGRKVFSLTGKFEARKFTDKLIRLWCQKYKNNKNYSLNLLVYNPFFSPEDNDKLLRAAFGGSKPWNVNILPRLKTNAEVNDLYCATDIDISGLGSESWSLPSFDTTCLGKWSIALNGMGQKAWATEENSILVEPSGWRECYDDAFFRKGGEFNQGNFLDVSDESIIDAFERAEKKIGTKNQKGLDLGREFTYGRTVDQILTHLC